MTPIRKIAFATLAAPLALGLAACGSNGGEDGVASGEPIAPIAAPEGTEWTETVTVSEAKAGKPSFFTVKAVNIPAAKMVSIRIFDTTELEANQVMSGCFSRGDMMVTGKSIPWALLWLYQR